MKINISNQSYRIRNLQKKDWAGFHAIYSDERLMKFIGGAIETSIIERMFEEKLQAWNISSDFTLTLVIEDDNSQRILGLCGFKSIKQKPLELDMGIIIKRNAQCRGYTEQVLSDLIKLVQESLGAMKVGFSISADNRPAIKMAEKLGYKLVGKSHSSNESYSTKEVFHFQVV